MILLNHSEESQGGFNGMINKFLILIKRISLCFLLIILFFTVNGQPAWAHRPHDVVTQLEISPSYNQDKAIFIVVRDNLFKSTDGGDKWTRLIKGLDNSSDLESLAISSQNPNFLLISSLGNGIYKSENGGSSWLKVNNGLTDSKVDLIEISPQSDAIILAAGYKKGLYRTEDEGNNWVSVIKDKKITAIAFYPEKKEQVLAGDNQGKLSISEDEGKTWSNLSTLKNQGTITTIAISPNFSKDKTVLVGTDKGGVLKSGDRGVSFVPVNQGITDKNIRDIVIVSTPKKDLDLFVSTWNEAVFRSTDRGKTWVQNNKGLLKESQADELHSPHFGKIRVSPAFNQDQTIFIGGFNGLFQSTNDGKSWQELETLSKGTITSLAISPNYQKDSSLALVTYVGNIYISRDQGKTWISPHKGLEIPRFTNSFKKRGQDPRRFFDVAFSPNYEADKTLFATVLWTNVLKSTNQGENWKIIALPDAKGEALRGLTIVASPSFASDKTLYIGTQYGGIFRSTDRGKTFAFLSNVGNQRTNEPLSLVISPNFSIDKTLYAAGTNGVYQSLDGGATWKSLTEGTPLSQKKSIQLAISPNYQADKTLLAGTNQGLFITKDQGKSWSEIQSSAYGKEVYAKGVAISPDYKKDQTFIISTQGRGLFKTVDGGQNFTKIGDDTIELGKMNAVPSAGIPIHFSPAYAVDKTLYGFGSATTDVYKSTDGGNTWEVISLPQVNHDSYDWLTYLSLWLKINRRQVTKIVAAIVGGLLAYFLFGYLKLEKKLPISKPIAKVGVAIIVFVAILILL
jgi:photosystem II stability/assembly factor-like uncharacterized protein